MRPLRHPFGNYFFRIWYKKEVAGGSSILFPPKHKYVPSPRREVLFKRLDARRADRFKQSKRRARINLWMLGRHDHGCRANVRRSNNWKRRL